MDDIVLPDIVYDGIDLEILSPDMIEHEQTCDQLDEIKYLVDVFQHHSAARKNVYVNMWIDLVACLAWEDYTTRHSRVKKEVLQSLLQNSVEDVLNNYRHKQYAIDSLFKYVPGQDFPPEVKAFFQDKMTNAPTNTFKNRNKSAVVGKSAEDQAKVAFGKSIQLIAAKSRAYISKNMTPNYFLEEDIPSGCQIQDVLYAIRRRVCYPYDILEKLKEKWDRKNVPDKNQQIKAAYVASMSQYLDHCYRPRPYLAFLICGVPAGPNGLLSLCPRTTVDIETKTQEKVVRNAQRDTAAKAAGLKRKTVPEGEGQGHHVTHIHNHVFGAAAVDMLATLKEKRQAIADSVKMFEQVGDDEMADTYRRHWVRANDDYIKALDDN